MTSITTKFDLGQRVFYAGTSIAHKLHDCPDCLGTKVWKVVSPAGGEFEAPCPRCSTNYTSNDDLSLKYSTWAPAVTAFEIARIDASTHNSRAFLGEEDRGPQYFSDTSGGSIYRERDLFATEEEAATAAQATAAVQNADATHWTAKQYDRTVSFSDYQLKDAAIESANTRRIHAQVDNEMLRQDILDAETLDEAKGLVGRYEESSNGYSRGVVLAANLLAKTARACFEGDEPPAMLSSALEEWDTIRNRKPA